jgi:mRNA interferase RelE/StbE
VIDMGLQRDVKTIRLQPSAAKALDKIPEPHRSRIATAVRSYAAAGTGDVRKLQGRSGYRLRVGDYRVIFDDDREGMVVLDIATRQQAYR